MKTRTMRIIALLIICALVFCGCKKSDTKSDSSSNKSDDKKTEETDNRRKIGFSAIDMENPYFITLQNAILEILDDEKYELIVKDPSSDPAAQNEQIEEMIDEGIEAIFLCPVNWESITDALVLLKDAGVKVINVDTQVKAMEYVDAYIGSDNEKAGYICGEDLIEKKPEGGNVLILECPTQNSINERITGFEKALSSASVGFEVVDRADTNGEFEKALEVTREMLEKYPDIDVIMCGNDQIAVGATTAANLAERKDIIIYGVDGSPDIKKELVKPETLVAGTAAQSPINMGKEAARIAIAMLKDKEYEKETYMDVFMINSKNVEMYGVDGWQ